MAMRLAWIVLHVAGAVMAGHGVAVVACVVADGGYTHTLAIAGAVKLAGVAYCVEGVRDGLD